MEEANAKEKRSKRENTNSRQTPFSLGYPTTPLSLLIVRAPIGRYKYCLSLCPRLPNCSGLAGGELPSEHESNCFIVMYESVELITVGVKTVL